MVCAGDNPELFWLACCSKELLHVFCGNEFVSLSSDDKDRYRRYLSYHIYRRYVLNPCLEVELVTNNSEIKEWEGRKVIEACDRGPRPGP